MNKFFGFMVCDGLISFQSYEKRRYKIAYY
jgi:hypothetical protein